jgi:hypothetical protein
VASHFLWPRFKRTRGAGVDALGVVGVRAGPPYLSESVTVLALIHRSNHLACS